MPEAATYEEHDDVLGRAFDRRLASRLWASARAHHRLVWGSVVLFPFITLVELAQPYLLKVAIDDHILRADWTGLTAVAVLYAAALGALYALRLLEAFLMALTGQRVIHDLRARLFEHLLRLEAGFFDRTPVGRLMTRVLSDVEAVSEAFTSGLFAVVADVVTLAGVVAIMLWMDWRLALVTFAIVPVLFAVAGYFRLRARDAYREVRRRLARLNAFLQESIQGMAVIQLFAREAHEREQFQARNEDYRCGLFASTRYEASLYAAVEALGSVALAMLVWDGGGRILDGALTFGALVAFIQYTTRFFLPIRDLGAKYAVMQAAVVSSERIFGLLDTEPSIRSNGAAVTAPVADRRTPAVEFRNVWFAYHDDEWVLRDCSLTVERGEQVALVGPTGEGKTTIARLITRVYEASRGQVLVEGRDVRDWDLRELRRHVGLIPQEVFLFSGTVEANLRLGSDGAVTNAELRNAIVAANATRLIEALPSGLAEEIRERGANLSHGQRQLLAIARALIYNPRVLALDEAMSSVDPESEALIREALARLLTGRTSVVIAHRLSTIQRADRILVLHKGRVRESGRHAELLAQHGLYSWLYELQFGLVRS